MSESARTTLRQSTPAVFPFASTVDGSANSKAPRAAETVRSPARISPGAAACSSRAATLTASPRAADDDLSGVDADPQGELGAEGAR